MLSLGYYAYDVTQSVSVSQLQSPFEKPNNFVALFFIAKVNSIIKACLQYICLLKESLLHLGVTIIS